MLCQFEIFAEWGQYLIMLLTKQMEVIFNFGLIHLETVLVKLILLMFSVQLMFANSIFDENVLKTWKNNTFHGIRGMKYSEAPLGPLRFKASL